MSRLPIEAADSLVSLAEGAPSEADDPLWRVAEPELALVPVAEAWLLVPEPEATNFCPTVGRATLPLTFQRPGVDDGQAGAVNDGEYAATETPVGASVAH